MRLSNSEDLGRYVRDRRRAAGFSQTDLATRAAVSRRWLSDLEAGKATAEVGLVFKVTAALGLYLDAKPEYLDAQPEYLDAQPEPTPGAGVQMIRAAVPADAETMLAIEVAAGRQFADVGMGFVADADPGTVEELLEYMRDGRAWVFADEADRPIAYLIALWVDGYAHVEQVSVHPDVAGRRIGAALVEHLAGWARERGAPALTLTTYAEVAWNAPYYERLGFRRLDDAEISPGLRRIREAEAAHGLDRWPRVVMRRELGPNDA